MPATINGIGTTYYGRSNETTRPGECPHCRRQTTLNSYDTKLWFVVVFVPLIPLGRKRILDQCSSCRKHYVFDAAKWEAMKQAEISGAREKFRTTNTSGAAMVVHQQMLNYQQLAEAAAFRATITAQFPDDAGLHAYLGESLHAIGRDTEAAPYYARAFALQPTQEPARIGVAREHQAAGRLDEARRLLDFLEKPGAGQTHALGPLETLAYAYQAANRHGEAVALFRVLLDELPSLQNHRDFRAKVKKSEDALGRSESVLTASKFQWGDFFRGAKGYGPLRIGVAISAIVLVVVGGFAFGNEVIRRQRPLILVNHSVPKATVQIEGLGEFTVLRGKKELAIPEGTYHATILGATRTELDFTIATPYFSRWGDESAWVINVDGAAVLWRETAVYSTSAPPGSANVSYGRAFEHFPEITNRFSPLPASVSVKRGQSRTLTSLNLNTQPLVEVFAFIGEKNPHGALDFAEHQLNLHPDDSDLLRAYATEIHRREEQPRLDQFLRSHLGDRPVRIDWHRAYQFLHQSSDELPKLLSEYDALLAAGPDDSALLYLRGRIEPARDQARTLHQRAIAADAKNPYPFYALGHEHALAAEWADAAQLLSKASALRSNDKQFAEALYRARLGAGQAVQIEAESRAILQRKPHDWAAALHLIQALSVQGRRNEIPAVTRTAHNALVKRHGDDPSNGANSLSMHGAYAAHDFALLEQLARKTKDAHAVVCVAQLEADRLDAARKNPALKASQASMLGFGLILAEYLHGNRAEAETALQRAIEALSQHDGTFSQLAQRLKQPAPLTLDEVLRLDVTPELKPALIAALAQRQTEHRASLQAFARALNVVPQFPYHLVNRACGAVE